jgi:hypothetical protein
LAAFGGRAIDRLFRLTIANLPVRCSLGGGGPGRFFGGGRSLEETSQSLYRRRQRRQLCDGIFLGVAVNIVRHVFTPVSFKRAAPGALQDRGASTHVSN